MPTDRELLQQLFEQLKARTFVVGDEATIKSMVQTMRHPPMTMRSRVVMQLTLNEYQQLAQTLTEVEQHLKDEVDAET